MGFRDSQDLIRSHSHVRVRIWKDSLFRITAKSSHICENCKHYRGRNRLPSACNDVHHAYPQTIWGNISFPKTDLKHLFNHFDWNGGPFVAWNSHSFGIEGRVILKRVVHQGWSRADGRVLILAVKGFASDRVRLVIVDAPCERQPDLLKPQSTWAKSPNYDAK